MKVFALIIFAVASASGKGSGPYLPSGWRPTGPAFVLPTEVKPAENPIQDVILTGSEASGSDFLREYGPPKVQEITQNLINQGLPDVVTEQVFDAVSPFVIQDVSEVETDVKNVEAKTEESSTVESEAATESVLENKTTINLPYVEIEHIETQTTLADGVATTSIDVLQVTSESSQNTETIQQISERTETSQSQESPSVENKIEKVSEQVSQESNQQSESVTSISETVAEKSGQTEAIILVAQNEDSNLQQAQNIPDIIANLENEAKKQQVEVNQAVSDLSSIQVSGSLEQAPEGFLEYGPPGFTEYGPPKELSANEDKSANLLSFETNETRRRRFSPKFRPSRKH